MQKSKNSHIFTLLASLLVLISSAFMLAAPVRAQSTEAECKAANGVWQTAYRGAGLQDFCTSKENDDACRLQGGIWVTEYQGSTQTNRCKILPKTGSPTTEADCIQIGGTWSPRDDSCSKKYDSVSQPGVSTTSAAAGSDQEPPKPTKTPEYQADCKSEGGAKIDESNCGIIKYLNIGFDVVSGVVIIGVIANIIISGIMYSMAQGDPGNSAKAKGRIQQGAIALLLYFMLYGFIQWLIPGGAF